MHPAKITSALLSLCLVFAFAASPATASSHREAPLITEMPKVDGTDFYMFRSYEEGREGFVTLLANYVPLQDPYGGPNYFFLDPQAHYRIHIDNDGDGIEDLTFLFRVGVHLAGIALPVGDETVPIPLVKAGPGPFALDNVSETYSVELIRGEIGSGRSESVFLENALFGGGIFGKPLDNIGRKTFPDYESYARFFVTEANIPGCGVGRVFVGQRKDPFVVNLGETFDLVNLDPLGDPAGATDDLEDANVTTFALEVPIDCLTGESDVIGGWTTATLPRTRVLSATPGFADVAMESAARQRVSRLGMPLVNELVIGLPDKNLFNASRPDGDAALAFYVTHPTLPELLEILFPVEAPNNFPRNDLVAAFVTGIPGLNELGFGEMQRLNTAIPPTPAAEQSRLGALGGDLAGFPNGRRPGDDVVDVELRVAMGVLCHAFPGTFCEPEDAPSGDLPFTDGAFVDASFFDTVFPYATTPIPGAPASARPDVSAPPAE